MSHTFTNFLRRNQWDTVKPRPDYSPLRKNIHKTLELSSEGECLPNGMDGGGWQTKEERWNARERSGTAEVTPGDSQDKDDSSGESMCGATSPRLCCRSNRRQGKERLNVVDLVPRSSLGCHDRVTDWREP